MARTALTIVFVAVATASASAQAAALSASKTRLSPLTPTRYQVVVRARAVAPFGEVSGLDASS